VFRRAGGEWEMLRYPHNIPAAIMDDAVYKERTVQLYEGDMIFVYTDGVTDTVNTRDEQFGESRITEALNADSCGQTKAVIDGLLAQIELFSEDAEQFDDIGMVCFRYHVRKSENGENKK
jgi:serine phosphatase RsbU (regulator of sigma subunit)